MIQNASTIASIFLAYEEISGKKFHFIRKGGDPNSDQALFD
jgi:hypothetical protein